MEDEFRWGGEETKGGYSSYAPHPREKNYAVSFQFSSNSLQIKYRSKRICDS